MATCNDTYDLLTTASRINRAGRELIPLLRALPKPMLRTCNPVADKPRGAGRAAGPGRSRRRRAEPDRRAHHGV